VYLSAEPCWYQSMTAPENHGRSDQHPRNGLSPVVLVRSVTRPVAERRMKDTLHEEVRPGNDQEHGKAIAAVLEEKITQRHWYTFLL
jgi:hypothetical protein